MTFRRRKGVIPAMTGKKWGLVGLGLVLAVSACGSSGHHSATATSSTTSTGPPAPTSATSASSTTSSSDVTSSSSTTAITPSGPQRCTTASLAGALTNENGTAGSVYYTLELTNRGSTTCVLQGWPGVSFVTGGSGSQVGAAATRIPGSAPSVSLAPGGTAGATLQITEATNYGSGCQVTPVSGLRVYPPNQTASLYVAHTDNACANTTDVTLHVGAFQASS